jgi:hypothetical protein
LKNQQHFAIYLQLWAEELGIKHNTKPSTFCNLVTQQNHKNMKTLLTSLLIYALILVSLIACDKEQTSKKFYPSFKVEVNGQKQSIESCGTSNHVAQFLKDTAVFVGFGCGGKGIGFFLKGRIIDGTYPLDHNNQAWYESQHITYKTDSIRKGTVTIRTGSFQAPNGIIPYIEGEIAFEAINRTSGNIVKLTEGKFLLKKYAY